MHSLLILASLLATLAPRLPCLRQPWRPRPHPRAPATDEGEIARLDPYGGWRDDSRQDPVLLTLLREQNRWTEQQLAGQAPLVQRLQTEWQGRERGEPVPDDWLSQAGSQWRMEADGSLWQRSDANDAPRKRLAPRQPAEGITSSPPGPCTRTGNCLPWPKTAGEIGTTASPCWIWRVARHWPLCLTAPAICSGVWLTSSPP